MRPAVNVGLSVSRVGGAAQTKAMKRHQEVSVSILHSIVKWKCLRSSVLIWMRQPKNNWNMEVV